MAKIIVVLLLLLGAGFYFYKEQKAYLKEETMLRFANKGPFLKKEPASWMLEQIEADFQGISNISQEAVQETFDSLHSPMAIRYRIVDNELWRYFREGEPISLSDNNTERAIKTILHATRLPNMDFIISYYDAFPFGPLPKAPILVSAKLKNTPNALLIPDWRSIGHWWVSDIKAIKKEQIPWENKRPFALWRGGLTKEVRLTLCQLSLEHPDILDARLSSAPETEEEKRRCAHLMGTRTSWSDFLSCKYLPYVDGVMCAAPALQWRLLSGSLTFKPDSEEIQWFTSALKPFLHYVPVKSDLSDLVEKIEWAKAHDAECKQIAEEAHHFAKENILYHDVLNYFYLVLKRYGSCQRLNELSQDPRWVNIHRRKKIRQKEGFVYCQEGTPQGL